MRSASDLGALPLALALLAVAGCRREPPRPQSEPNRPEDVTAGPRLAAHRGATSQAPENSVAAVRLAFERGADGVEVDVRLSADRVPVLCHDEDTARVAGVARRVAEQTAAELAALDLGGGERIPTLREALAIVPAGKILWLDLKIEPDEVETVLAAVPRGAPVMLQAFSMPVLAQALVIRPDLPGYFLAAGRRDAATGRRGPVSIGEVERVRAVGVAGLAVDHQGITDELLAEIGRGGVALYVWTYPDPDSARRSAPAGAAWTEAEF